MILTIIGGMAETAPLFLCQESVGIMMRPHVLDINGKKAKALCSEMTQALYK